MLFLMRNLIMCYSCDVFDCCDCVLWLLFWKVMLYVVRVSYEFVCCDCVIISLCPIMILTCVMLWFVRVVHMIVYGVMCGCVWDVCLCTIIMTRWCCVVYVFATWCVWYWRWGWGCIDMISNNDAYTWSILVWFWMFVCLFLCVCNWCCRLYAMVG